MSHWSIEPPSGEPEQPTVACPNCGLPSIRRPDPCDPGKTQFVYEHVNGVQCGVQRPKG